MKRLPIKTVDVFTSVAFQGNPVAVVLDGGGLSTAQMQQIAHWTNLSETTFVVPATDSAADYHVRIFTPGAELPFAGHPTIGTAHALLEAGMVQERNGVLVQQCKKGLIQLRVTQVDGARTIAFELPAAQFTNLDAAQSSELEAILGATLTAPPCLVDVGPRWVIAQLSSAQAVLDVMPDLARMKLQDSAGGHTGVVIFGKQSEDASDGIEVRAFAPAHGIGEDPVCGSGNGAVAAYIRHRELTPEFGSAIVATQGKMVGRSGVLQLSISGQSIQVGGCAVTCIDGHLMVALPSRVG